MKMLGVNAKQYGVRPSEILKIKDEWAAYQLDVVVTTALNNGFEPSKHQQPTLKNLGGVQWQK